ncbi:MAG TPA: ATP-dependent 6-phosphofructokinase [Acidimicrobiia bacterium]|nr:ATP-dependent 6-phosphofructokinase [Acidimicrobiia bacterium]
MATIGLLTAGGDCPGLNAVIRAVTATAVAGGHSVVGFRNGWAGLMDDDPMPLDRNAVRGILGRGGTILGTSRRDPYVHGEGAKSIAGTTERHGLQAIVVVGGDGTLRTAARIDAEGIPIVGIPKTIDNDVPGTDVSFGFDTAVEIATDAIDRLTTTAEAHNRVQLVEVMGRSKGWIAIHAGIAAGADVILIPEFPMPLDEAAGIITRRHDQGHNYSVVVVAEGIDHPREDDLPSDTYGFTRLGGVAYWVAPVLEELTGFETRVTVLGHLQRGGTPSARDRILATRLGAAAIASVERGEHGVMMAVRGTTIEPIPISNIGDDPRGVPRELWDVARAFFG